MPTTSPTPTQHSSVEPILAPPSRTADRIRQAAYVLAMVVHGILALLFAGVVLVARDLRDCGIFSTTECDGATGGESAADLSALAIGAASWAALTFFFFKSKDKPRVYWAFLISPAWFFVATRIAAALILSSS